MKIDRKTPKNIDSIPPPPPKKRVSSNKPTEPKYNTDLTAPALPLGPPVFLTAALSTNTATLPPQRTPKRFKPLLVDRTKRQHQEREAVTPRSASRSDLPDKPLASDNHLV